MATDELMKELAAGRATFELRELDKWKRFGSLFTSFSSLVGKNPHSGPCFARLRQEPLFPAKRKEHYTVHHVAGDGRCMFRALALGMAANDGVTLSFSEERDEADELRLSVKDVICTGEKQRTLYEEALIAITVEQSISRYCRRIAHSSFWGGESELLVLSRMYKQPIIVYIPENEAKGGSWGTGYIPIAEYGIEFLKATKEQHPCKPVRLLYSGSNHYDLLL